VHWDEDWLGELVPRLIALRRGQPVLRRMAFLDGDRGDGSAVDVRWLGPDGHELGDAWQPPEVRTLAALYDGGAVDERAATLLVAYHADGEPGRLPLPPGRFTVLLDSADPRRTGPVGEALDLEPWSVVILRDEA
jgi:glycogen operon protein